MKSIRRILAVACSVLLVLALTSAMADTARFSLKDMNVSYVYVGASQDEATAVFGTPENTETATSAATGETTEIWHYAGLALTFSADKKLIGADVSDAAHVGPRGVTLGQTLEEVATKFYLMNNAPAGSVLYTAGYVLALDAQLPPCGFIRQFEGDTFAVVYAAPSAPFGEDVTADPTNFVYQQLATFTVYFDKDSKVTGYSWYLGPWAE